MRRDPADLASTHYDLLVVGGGIHGLFAAYDAATRGMTVALIERADFGGGLSFSHQRTIHGGLRDVGAARFGKARRQIAERRTWAHIAPHLLRPLPFLVGTYGRGTRSRLAVRTGFAIYDALGRHRNDDVAPELHLPKTRLESVATTRRLFRGIREQGLTGGAVWYDYQMRHPDRLTWTVALAAMAAGARLANYVEADGPLPSTGGAGGVVARDLESGREIPIRATAILLAVGSGLAAVHRQWHLTGAPPFIGAMNLLIDRPAHDLAVAAPGRSGRMLTAVPWRGRVLVGTFQSPGPIGDETVRPGERAISDALADANLAFPALAAAQADLRLVHYGLVPAMMREGRADLLGESRLLEHAQDGHPHVFSLVGTKFTTARAAAEHAVTRIGSSRAGTMQGSFTASSMLPHCEIADVHGRLEEAQRALGIGLPADVADHLAGWYGTEAPAVLRFTAERDLGERLTEDQGVLAGEIAYAVMHAQAAHLDDAVLRRTPLGSAGHPGRPALERAGAVMAAACGWSSERTAQEIRRVEAAYPPT